MTVQEMIDILDKVDDKSVTIQLELAQPYSIGEIVDSGSLVEIYSGGEVED